MHGLVLTLNGVQVGLATIIWSKRLICVSPIKMRWREIVVLVEEGWDIDGVNAVCKNS
jgi:hypothetical protein